MLNISFQTALSEVFNHSPLTLDSNSTLVLLLLDLSVTFDTTDHCLKSVWHLAWLKSYFSDRTSCVSYSNTASIFTDVKCGVPPGSVFWPFALLFIIFASS